MEVVCICDWCGKEFKRDECYMRGKRHHFCCRQCLWDFSNKEKNPGGYDSLKDLRGVSAHMSQMNREMNSLRMTPETRAKIRVARLGRGKCEGYSKIYGKPAHRVVAEQLLGRHLLPEEVVHHRDGNPYNNVPENLQVFPNRAAHAHFHHEFRSFLKEIERMEEDDE